jgi:hypothetical protein
MGLYDHFRIGPIRPKTVTSARGQDRGEVCPSCKGKGQICIHCELPPNECPCVNWSDEVSIKPCPCQGGDHEG